MADQATAGEAPLDSLDDNCFLRIFHFLPTEAVINLGLTCKRALGLSGVDTIWDALLWKEFGLHASVPHVEDSKMLYKRFAASGGDDSVCVPPMRAVLTDKGVDEPWSTHWAGNCCHPSPRAIFCSSATTVNAHVLAVLDTPALPVPSPFRTFLIGRLKAAAAYLLPEPTKLAVEINEDMGYQFKSPNTLMEALPEPSAAQVAQAVAKLERCSDRGLEDLFLFLHARLSGEHLLGRLLLEGLDSEEEVNTLHNAAWHIWHGSTHPPEMEILRLRSGDDMLLYDPQAASLIIHPSMKRSFGVFSSVVVDRHSSVTCPAKSGAVFVGHITETPSVVGARQAAENTEEAAGWGEMLLKRGIVEALNSAITAEQVLDLSDEGVLPPIMSYCATSRAEFIEFCRPADPDSVLHKDGSTLYPMVWFRFFTRVELAQMTHLAGEASGQAGGSSAAGADDEDGIGGGDYFYNASDDDDEDDDSEDDDEDDDNEDDDEDEEGEEEGAAAAAADDDDDDDDDDISVDMDADSDDDADVSDVPVAMDASGGAHGSAGESGTSRVSRPDVAGTSDTAGASGTAGTSGAAGKSRTAGTSGTAGTLASMGPSSVNNENPYLRTGCTADVGPGDVGHSCTVGHGKAPRRPEWVETGMAATNAAPCPLGPNLTADAPEAGYSFGHGPPPQKGGKMMLHMRLRQSWSANMMVVKLIEAENLQPRFNVDRGGCNIDVGYVSLLGHVVNL